MEIILKYFPDLSQNQKLQFRQLQPLYNSWNKKINVISRKDIGQLYERHILHSLGIAKIISFKKDTSLLDVGSGGGFPGIPLAIMFPECQFLLVDSIGKKVNVIEAIASEIGLQNVRTDKIRAEQLTGKFDFIVSRAVTGLPTFTTWVKNRVSEKHNNSLRNGIIYLKGGNIQSEISSLKMKTQVFPLSGFFEEDFFTTKAAIHIYK